MSSSLPVPIPDECRGCGACCSLTIDLRPEDSPPKHLIRTTTDSDGTLHRTLAQAPSGFCAALDPLTHACTIYDQRPGVCRDFEHGSTACACAVNRHPWLVSNTSPR